MSQGMRQASFGPWINCHTMYILLRRLGANWSRCIISWIIGKMQERSVCRRCPWLWMMLYYCPESHGSRVSTHHLWVSICPCEGPRPRLSSQTYRRNHLLITIIFLIEIYSKYGDMYKEATTINKFQACTSKYTRNCAKQLSHFINIEIWVHKWQGMIELGSAMQARKNTRDSTRL